MTPAASVRSRLRYGALTLVIASVPVVLMMIGSSRGERGTEVVPVWQSFALGAAQWYPFAIAAPFIDRLVRRSRPAARTDYARVLAGHAALLTILVATHAGVVVATDHSVYPREASNYWRQIHAEWLPDAILYSAIAAGFTIGESRRRQTEVAERLRAEVAEARLDALRQQLNPHFLFNTLNHIVMQLRGREVEPAERMLLALSDLLRDVLRERAQLIPLRDELRMVERYLEIERERFGDRLQVEITFEPRALDSQVPSLILQPLLENAMRHGVSAADGTCRVWLTARTRGDRLLIEVRDAGPGLDPRHTAVSAGVGLTNTTQRLRYLYGADHTFTLKTIDGNGLLASLDLPLRRAS